MAKHYKKHLTIAPRPRLRHFRYAVANDGRIFPACNATKADNTLLYDMPGNRCVTCPLCWEYLTSDKAYPGS